MYSYIGNPGEVHPLLSALRREIKYTTFSDIAEQLPSPVMSSVALDQSYSNTTTVERLRSSSSPSSSSLSSLNKASSFSFSTTSSSTSSLSSPPSSANLSPGSISPISPRGVKRSATTVVSQDYCYQSQVNPTIRTAASNNSGPLSVPPPTPSSISTTSPPSHSQQYSMYDTGSNNGPLAVDGIDPDYIPIRRRRHAGRFKNI